MAKLRKIEPIVREILENNPQTREDDFLLIAEVYNAIVPECVELPFSVVMLGHKTLGVPNFESIRRTRQRLQATHEELKPSKKVQEARLNETAEYIDYAIGGYNSNFMNFVDSQK